MAETDLVIALLAKDGASKVLEGVGSKIGSLGSMAKLALAGVAALTATVGGALAGLTAMAEKSAASAREVAKLSRETGLGAIAASKLSYAGKRLGIDSEALSKSFGILSKSIESNHPSLEKHNIDIVKAKDGHVDLDKTLGNIADRFKSMPDGVEKTALALDLFGKSGKDMIPLLNKGRDGLKELGDEAAKMGLVFDDKALAAAKRLTNAHKDLDDRIEGLKNRVGIAFMPVLADWAGGLVNLADRVLPTLSAGLDRVTGFVRTAIIVFGDIKAAADFKQIGGGDALASLIGPANAGKFMDLVSQISAKWQVLWIFNIRPALEWAQENVPKIWEEMRGAIAKAWDIIRPKLEAFRDQLGEMKDRFNALPEPIKKWAEATAVGVVAVKATGLDDIIQGWANALGNFVGGAAGGVTALKALGASALLATAAFAILTAAVAAVIFVGTHLDELSDSWTMLTQLFRLQFAEIADAAVHMWRGILEIFQWAVNTSIEAINGLIRALNLIPGVNIPLISKISIDLPNADNVRNTLNDIARDRTTHIAVQYTGGDGNVGLTQYATGTPYVPETGPAILHRGEAVIPAGQNPFTSGGMGGDQVIHTYVTVELNGREIARATETDRRSESRRRGTTLEPSAA